MYLYTEQNAGKPQNYWIPVLPAFCPFKIPCPACASERYSFKYLSARSSNSIRHFTFPHSAAMGPNTSRVIFARSFACDRIYNAHSIRISFCPNTLTSFCHFPRGSFIIPDRSGRRCSAIAVFFSVPVPIPLISCSSSAILISVSGSSAWKPKNKENGTRLQ